MNIPLDGIASGVPGRSFLRRAFDAQNPDPLILDELDNMTADPSP